MRDQAQSYFAALQDAICAACEEVDGAATFRRDTWTRPGGGGGLTRILSGGRVFEKGGVNTSTVFGRMPESLAANMHVPVSEFYATGVSLVLHPLSPMIPTVHANFRYFERDDGDAWFGGGCDLTPYYLFAEDARHFHTTLRTACDADGTDRYRRFKAWCDEYFFIRHRGEARGIGGVFFDYLRETPAQTFALVRSVGDIFLNAYLPIVRRRMEEPWGEREREWQLLRRGRYVEFNLVYDRGTVFGLETGGRTESILMSLPPLARWEYDILPEPGTREYALVECLRRPVEWADDTNSRE